MQKIEEHPKILIEEWFPFIEVGIESRRERGASSALPPVNYLHVWWARRPLIASRAAILASSLPSSFSRKSFNKMMNFDDSLIESFKLIEKARKQGRRIKNPYKNERAFKNNLNKEELKNLKDIIFKFWGKEIKLLDSMSGGGSIPFEGYRLGLKFISSELNPVAVIIQDGTIKFPLILGENFLEKMKVVFHEFSKNIKNKIKKFYSSEFGEKTQTYLFARTVICPNPKCNLIVPLSPNWDLERKGNKITLMLKLNIPKESAECKFLIMENLSKDNLPNKGTVKNGIGECPRCRIALSSEYINKEALEGRMGNQMITVVYQEIIAKKKVRKYRPPNEEDLEFYRTAENDLKKNISRWKNLRYIPTEDIKSGLKTKELLNKGINKWSNLFNSRQLLIHLIILEEIIVLKEKLIKNNIYKENEINAIITYLQFCLDKLLDRNSNQTRWNSSYQRVVNTFDRHDFGFKWSYGEMDLVMKGLDWALNNILKAYKELCELQNNSKQTPIIQRADAKNLSFLENDEIDVIIIDPPYYDNVMYAELSDFFYVWMKKSLKTLYPNILNSELTDKDNEVVANPSRFEGMGSSKKNLAMRDYESKMELCFKEMNRVLQKNGVLTIMFTHKSTDAWDTLAMSLMEAGFEITASWPVHTEADLSLHIAKKNSVKTTIFLVCRKRLNTQEELWWEDDVLPSIKKIVSEKTKEFRKLGIEGVDLFISCFGPALKEFSKSYPVRSISGNPIRAEEAIEAARRVVIDITLQDIIKGKSYNIDPISKFYLTAWHFFKARSFPFDEARRLALSIGINIDDLKTNHKLLNKKSGDVELLMPKDREKNGTINIDNPKDNGILINAVHIALLAYEQGGQKLFDSVVEKLRRNTDKSFRFYMETLFNILPDVKDLAKNLPEKKTLGEILMTTEEKITPKGGKITDFIE